MLFLLYQTSFPQACALCILLFCLKGVTTAPITPRMRHPIRLKTTSPREIQPKPLLTSAQPPSNSPNIITAKSLNKVQPVTRALPLASSTPLVASRSLPASAAAALASISVPAPNSAISSASPVIVSDQSGSSTPVQRESTPSVKSDVGLSTAPTDATSCVAPTAVVASTPTAPHISTVANPGVMTSQILSGEPTKPSTVITTVSSNMHTAPMR